MMRAVRGKDTKPELKVRGALHAAGFRFRLHGAHLPGRPDIVLPRLRFVVFVHGCFWHGHDCQRGRLPTTNRLFWEAKVNANKFRDAKTIKALRRTGWRVRTVWQCQLDATVRRLLRELHRERARLRR